MLSKILEISKKDLILGFISNDEELSNLTDDDYIDKLVNGLYNGIYSYIDKYVKY